MLRESCHFGIIFPVNFFQDEKMKYRCFQRVRPFTDKRSLLEEYLWHIFQG